MLKTNRRCEYHPERSAVVLIDGIYLWVECYAVQETKRKENIDVSAS
jgi:hypothetical protein